MLHRIAPFMALLFTVGCVGVALPEAPGPLVPSGSPNAARILFVLADPGDASQLRRLPRARSLAPGTAIDVLDRNGELLGRLGNRTWLEIEHPAGPTRFYSAPTTWAPDCLIGPCPEGHAQVGVLEANLEPGRTYAVWIGLGIEVGAFEVQTDCRGFVERNLDPSGAEWSLDLIAVRGTGWYEARQVQSHPDARSMRVAPRGIRHPYADEVRRAGDARLTSCWNAELSTLRADDAGLPSN